ncbi:MAG: prepilin-type N-terminal cleavage/methylation domain-containing protein [Planctomycetota bacterium]|nr:prepilin-type N-terminal cleavage/methylation domain-containing protein [Planctomycetota bacterium]
MHLSSPSTSHTSLTGRESSPRSSGFSLLEVLIVILIVAALLALAYPALRGAHQRSLKTRELSNLRQVGMAWFMYAQSNNDAAMPGYLDPEVQEDWDVTYDYPDEIVRSKLASNKIHPEIASAWTWRLMPYLSNAGVILREHLDEDYEPFELVEHARDIAFKPGFGYNGYYVGGYWTMTGEASNRRANFLFSKSRDMNNNIAGVVARSPSGIRASDRQIVFCSTTWRDTGVYQRGPNSAPGYHLSVPPILGDRPQWQIPGDSIENIFNDEKVRLGSGDHYAVEALTMSPTPIGRYTGAAVVFYADGHVDSQTPGALADQSKWIMGAKQVGETPARLFTHSFN